MKNIIVLTFLFAVVVSMGTATPIAEPIPQPCWWMWKLFNQPTPAATTAAPAATTAAPAATTAAPAATTAAPAGGAAPAPAPAPAGAPAPAPAPAPTGK